MLSTFKNLESSMRVAVVGSGLAGLSASIEAYRNGAQVYLFEKEPKFGGNSAKASSGMNAVGTSAQLEANIQDSETVFYEDTEISGGHRSDPTLVQVLVSNSKQAHAFIESFGVKLNRLSQCGGHRFPRTHRESPDPSGKPVSVGWDIVKALYSYIEKEAQQKSHPSFGSIQISLNTKVTQLIVKEGSVKGIKYQTLPSNELKSEMKEVSLVTDAVILTTGGYSANPKLLAEFTPHLTSFPTTNGAFAQGDGIELARSFTELIDMDQVQLHPTAFVHPDHPFNLTKFLAPEALRGHGGILVNALGERFVNELATRHWVTEAMLHQLKSLLHQPIYLILNEAMVNQVGRSQLQFYLHQKLFRTYSLKELMLTLFPSNTTTMTTSSTSLTSSMTTDLNPNNNHTNNNKKKNDMTEPDFSSSMTQTSTLLRTFQAYNTIAKQYQQHQDVNLSSNQAQKEIIQDAFGKTVFPTTLEPLTMDSLFYVAQITPALHYCMGGLKINSKAQIIKRSTGTKSFNFSNQENDLQKIDSKVKETTHPHNNYDGVVVPGLYGAGEVTGGVHGQNRLAGNSLLECVVFGRIAGIQASSTSSSIPSSISNDIPWISSISNLHHQSILDPQIQI